MKKVIGYSLAIFLAIACCLALAQPAAATTTWLKVSDGSGSVTLTTNYNLAPGTTSSSVFTTDWGGIGQQRTITGSGENVVDQIIEGENDGVLSYRSYDYISTAAETTDVTVETTSCSTDYMHALQQTFQGSSPPSVEPPAGEGEGLVGGHLHDAVGGMLQTPADWPEQVGVGGPSPRPTGGTGSYTNATVHNGTIDSQKTLCINVQGDGVISTKEVTQGTGWNGDAIAGMVSEGPPNGCGERRAFVQAYNEGEGTVDAKIYARKVGDDIYAYGEASTTVSGGRSHVEAYATNNGMYAVAYASVIPGGGGPASIVSPWLDTNAGDTVWAYQETSVTGSSIETGGIADNAACRECEYDQSRTWLNVGEGSVSTVIDPIANADGTEAMQWGEGDGTGIDAGSRAYSQKGCCDDENYAYEEAKTSVVAAEGHYETTDPDGVLAASTYDSTYGTVRAWQEATVEGSGIQTGGEAEIVECDACQYGSSSTWLNVSEGSVSTKIDPLANSDGTHAWQWGESEGKMIDSGSLAYKLKGCCPEEGLYAYEQSETNVLVAEGDADTETCGTTFYPLDRSLLAPGEGTFASQTATTTGSGIFFFSLAQKVDCCSAEIGVERSVWSSSPR